MGRAFEFRKARKFKRWDKMSKAFTRLGKEIVMAVKEGGPNPETNSRLRTAIQNAKGVNMPKDRVEAAIKRASSKEEKDYEEVVYEGYGPYGIAILVETATDNINRTVANMRVYFSRGGGALGKTGSLDFIFTRKGIFKIAPEGLDIEELELELIDAGAEDIYEHEGEIIVETAFTDFGAMQKTLEEKGLNVISAELQRIPNTRTELNDEQAEEIENLIEKIEEDDDVQAVYHNMA
jgi:YebC/PmpR family DNA-binding regulatory protein